MQTLSKVSGIGNYCGDLMISEQDGKCYWSLGEYWGDSPAIEITRELYNELLKISKTCT
jgi:hypothetical protein